MNKPLHDEDFYTWAREQAALARRRDAVALDWEHVAEELEVMGNEVPRALTSAYRILGLHLLKWIYQPLRRSRSWRSSIINARSDIQAILSDNPGVKSRADELFAKGYERARRIAEAETGIALKKFPEAPPFTRQQAEDDEFWPDA
jgi:hypothetical protein